MTSDIARIVITDVDGCGVAPTQKKKSTAAASPAASGENIAADDLFSSLPDEICMHVLHTLKALSRDPLRDLCR